jgi:hypothetical protein
MTPTPLERAQWFIGIHKEQIEKGISPTFTSIKDAIAATDEIIKIFDGFYPPFLTSNYWKKVKEELVKLK